MFLKGRSGGSGNFMGRGGNFGSGGNFGRGLYMSDVNLLTLIMIWKEPTFV